MQLCPNAWLINFTNPSGMVTEVIIKHGGSIGETVLNEMLVAHSKYLPQFVDNIAELNEKGVECKDQVVRELISEGK